MSRRRQLGDAERKLIFKWKKEGIMRLGTTERCVSYVLNNYDENNFCSRKHLCGRKNKLSNQEINSGPSGKE
jgi:hypothetical protein